jgi:two-component system, OmpR family, sensor histidine kinase KdpD
VDYMQIEQVFTNLLSNCMKYAPASTTIHINVKRQSSDMVRVEVTNQGPLIPEEDLERIFDKFYRITSAERITGTGLGLSICKGIVEAHDGRIWAKNLADGVGFYFTLPTTLEGAPALIPVE